HLAVRLKQDHRTPRKSGQLNVATGDVAVTPVRHEEEHERVHKEPHLSAAVAADVAQFHHPAVQSCLDVTSVHDTCS
ncbi:hypothetical protein, partial [Streptomyces thermospinosisporus]|uniref:hypothetical protein n=1 Tax=Streptomyces thermospinosisporus TaxID=161482 RepID=UPI0031DB9BE3